MQFIFSYIAKRKRNGLDKEEKKKQQQQQQNIFSYLYLHERKKNHLRFDIPATFNQT